MGTVIRAATKNLLPLNSTCGIEFQNPCVFAADGTDDIDVVGLGVTGNSVAAVSRANDILSNVVLGSPVVFLPFNNRRLCLCLSEDGESRK
jgi:hypothetical protein